MFLVRTPESTIKAHFAHSTLFQKYIQRLPSLNTKKVKTNNENGGIDDLPLKTAGDGVEKLSKRTFQKLYSTFF